MRLFFELEGYDPVHREAWTRRLAGLEAHSAPAVTIAPDADSADYVIETLGRQSFIGGRVFSIAPESHYLRRPESTFAWDSGDFPTGRLPGLYCSLSRALLDPGRHRSFCYPLRYNANVEPHPPEDADRLFGFYGSVSSPLRHRLFTEFRPFGENGTALLRHTAGVWDSVFGSAGNSAREAYADALRRCRFFLCPRGNGLSSIRLFETMEAARVPVILSDDLVLPQCVDWNRCAIVFPESDLARLPAYLRSREPEWEELARNARREWENNFGETTLLTRVGSELQSIVAERRRPEREARWQSLRRIAPRFAVAELKSAVRRVQPILRRRKKT